MQAKATYGNTQYFKEYEEKNKEKTKEDIQELNQDMMQLFVEFGQMKEADASSEKVQEQVKKLRDFINDNFYTCDNKILQCLGKMYSGGGTMTENIDNAGGCGTAEFVNKAIEIFGEYQSYPTDKASLYLREYTILKKLKYNGGFIDT